MSSVGPSPLKGPFHRLYPSLLGALRGCVKHQSEYRGPAYRVVFKDKWAVAEHVLTGVGAKIHGGRWNCKHSGLLATYLSDHPQTAVAERLHYARLFAGVDSHDKTGWTLPRDFWDDFMMASVDINMELIDLTRKEVAREVRKVCNYFSPAIMVREWREDDPERESLVQCVGRAAAAAGFPAVMVPSARRPGAKNLVVFPSLLVGPLEEAMHLASLGSVPTKHHRFA